MSVISQILEERKVPALMKFADGRAVTKENFEERRVEMVKILRNEVYGKEPPAPAKVVRTVRSKKEKEYAGKGDVYESTISFETDKGEFSFPVTEVAPHGKANCPLFILVNFRPNVPDKYLPVEQILDGGCAVITIYYNDITNDANDGFTSGLAAMYDREKYNWGKIAMWAWSASRVMDCVPELGYADPARVAVVGHSRLGKTALVCASRDTRFYAACANDSGCSGDAMTRGKVGEQISDITTRFPMWFCEKYKSYAGKTEEMPCDQHFLVASIAPRKVLLGAAVEDTWADPDSQYLTACAASEAWETLGLRGFVHYDRLPVPGVDLRDGDVWYHLRAGTHFFSNDDWKVYLGLFNR